ncbi:hypothetical protein ACF0H5_020015 [Mactra antiquata]
MSGIEVKDAGGSRVQLVEVDGIRVCNFDRSPEEEGEIIKNLKTFTCRDDDVFILAPVKSGTHWVWEISSMLMTSQAVTMPDNKSRFMLEHQTVPDLEIVNSPRILNSHLDIKHLPPQIFEKRLKIIHVLRNPKDVMVSFYNHVKGIRCYGYNGQWNDFFKLFLQNELDYGSWFSYIKDWEKYIKDNPLHPIHIVYYEDLHKNSLNEIKRLGEFLGKSPSDNLVSQISQKCQFKNMYKDKMYPEDVRKQVFKGDFTMYRKGKVGDWKNWFTVKQNEEFDEIYQQEMSDTSLRFQYDL